MRMWYSQHRMDSAWPIRFQSQMLSLNHHQHILAQAALAQSQTKADEKQN